LAPELHPPVAPLVLCRLMAMRISQVLGVDSPRKFNQLRYAFRKHS
jgi:hypothetical protein